MWLHSLIVMPEILFSCSLDFVPIDLDEWWAKRFLANIDKLSWHSFDTFDDLGQSGGETWSKMAHKRRENLTLQVQRLKVPGWFSNGQSALGRWSYWESLNLNSCLQTAPHRVRLNAGRCCLEAEGSHVLTLAVDILWKAVKLYFEEILGLCLYWTDKRWICFYFTIDSSTHTPRVHKHLRHRFSCKSLKWSIWTEW